MEKNLIIIALALITLTMLTISCEKNFEDEITISKIEDSTSTSVVINNPIDTNYVVTIVPNIFVPTRKLSISNSFALIGYNKISLKNANDITDETGNADGLFQMIYDNDGNSIIDTVYTLGENDSVSVGNEIYVSSILDLNNDHVLLKGSFKFVLDTLGNTKIKNDLIVRKSDGYIVNFDDNDQEYNINYRLQNKVIRKLSNGDILTNKFVDNDTRRTIEKIVINENDIYTEEVLPELNLNIAWFDVDLNDNILYTDVEDGCFRMNIYHNNTGTVEHVGLTGRLYNDTLQFISYWLNSENEVFALFKGVNVPSCIFKMNITNNSYSLNLVDIFIDGETLTDYLLLSNGSESDYNFSDENNFIFFAAFNNDRLSWISVQNNTIDIKTIIGQDDAHTNILNANSDNYVYYQYDNKLIRATIETGDVVDNYFNNSDFEIISFSSSPDDVVTLGTIRTSDNANVIWEIDANGSAKIISETANVVVTSVENIE
jgi:hypothetical protein